LVQGNLPACPPKYFARTLIQNYCSMAREWSCATLIVWVTAWCKGKALLYCLVAFTSQSHLDTLSRYTWNLFHVECVLATYQCFSMDGLLKCLHAVCNPNILSIIGQHLLLLLILFWHAFCSHWIYKWCIKFIMSPSWNDLIIKISINFFSGISIMLSYLLVFFFSKSISILFKVELDF